MFQDTGWGVLIFLALDTPYHSGDNGSHAGPRGRAGADRLGACGEA